MINYFCDVFFNGRSSYDVHETAVVDAAAALFPGSGNPIDDFWRSNPNWALDRQHLAECAQGFGKMAFGGFNGSFYIVTDDTDDDMLSPAPGTLRYGVVQEVIYTLQWLRLNPSYSLCLTNLG